MPDLPKREKHEDNWTMMINIRHSHKTVIFTRRYLTFKPNLKGNKNKKREMTDRFKWKFAKGMLAKIVYNYAEG